MSLENCPRCNHTYDTDYLDECPICEEFNLEELE